MKKHSILTGLLICSSIVAVAQVADSTNIHNTIVGTTTVITQAIPPTPIGEILKAVITIAVGAFTGVFIHLWGHKRGQNSK